MPDNEILKLQKEIERLKKSIKRQKYGLVWMNIPEAFEDEVENKLPILKENPKYSINNPDEKPVHLLIEGDNYHTLSCLNYTHKNKVDIIYIDPPYNTGSDGFKYHDKRIQEKFPDGTEVPLDHPFRHSYWLSFIQKRLELSKNLLKDSGVIFISIDINELAQLKLLCDETFGESNLVSLISVKVKDPAGVGQQSFVFDVCEYVLMYCKDRTVFKNKYVELPMDYEEITDFYGSYTKQILDFGKPSFVKKIKRQNVGEIEIYSCKNAKVGSVKKLKFKEYIKNRDKIFADYNPNGGMILAIKDQIPQEGLSYLKYIPTKGRNAGQEVKTYFLNGRIISWLGTVTEFNEGKLLKRTKMINFWNIPNASLYLEGGVDFTNGKKPLKLIKKLLGMFKDTELVIDFFAGSGTTGQAVLELNEEDKGKRQFILATNNEGNILSNVCFPRLKNVMDGHKNEKGLGNSLKSYKTNFVGKNSILTASDSDKVVLAHNAGELLAIAENTLDLVKQNKFYQLFVDKQKMKNTAIYFREELDKFDEFLEVVEKLKNPTAVYVFSWGENEFSDDFDHLSTVNVKTIPLPILEIYKNIYNLGGYDV